MTLRETVDRYVAHRRAAGVAFETGERLLHFFCRQVGGERPCDEIPASRVRAFLDGRHPPNRYWLRKRSALAGFYRYATSRGYASRVPLPTRAPRLVPPLRPYIYTRAELRRLVDAAQQRPDPRSLLERGTLRILVLVLYGTGLRIGEAVGLALRDADLKSNLLTIRDAKFYKTRVVPTSPQLGAALSTYARQRVLRHPRSAAEGRLLVDRRGAPLRIKNVQYAFQRLREAAAVRRTDGARYQPRLHDLRHTFATHRLATWYREGQDVQALLPLLSTYLGHASVAETEPYLALTDELLRRASERFERYAQPQEGGRHA